MEEDEQWMWTGCKASGPGGWDQEVGSEIGGQTWCWIRDKD